MNIKIYKNKSIKMEELMNLNSSQLNKLRLLIEINNSRRQVKNFKNKMGQLYSYFEEREEFKNEANFININFLSSWY